MTGCTSMASNSEDLKAFILSLEEQALKLWNRGNPDGFTELSSDVAVLAYDYEAYRDDRTFRMHLRKYINWIRLNSGKSYIPIGLFVLPDNGGQNGNGRIFSLQEDAGILSTIISHLYLNHAFFTTVCLCIFVILLSDI